MQGLIGTVGISGSIKADGDVRVDVKSEKGIGLRAEILLGITASIRVKLLLRQIMVQQ